MSKPYKNDTDRNDDDVTDEILEMTITFLNNGSEKIGNYSFTHKNESIKQANDSGKLMDTSTWETILLKSKHSIQ